MSERELTISYREACRNFGYGFTLGAFMTTTLLAVILVTALGIYAGAYIASVPNGVLGGYLLGGWPALRRLVRHPRMQLTHWWHILRDTRRVQIREYPDGSTRVSIMRPTRRNGWSWREERGEQ